MKEIKAIIRPNKLPALRNALRQIPGFPGMTISKAEGCSALTRHGPPTNIKEELTDYTPKTRIEIVAPDDLAPAILDCICAVAQTGQVGDGLVWMVDVERALFIHKTMP
ncbi:MAG: nitrogen regulatory protein 1 [Pseudomonadota bacterium]|jgi:nitrogen regulatory protein P-II 1